MVSTSFIMTIFVLFLLAGDFDEELTKGVPTIWLVVLRWILFSYVHMTIDKDIKQGLRLMKYALNHPWKFKEHSESSGFFNGLIQLIVAVAVEIFSMLILL